MKCKDCPYYWADEGERYPTCKYGYGDNYAPCEVSDYEMETEEDDFEKNCLDTLEELMEQNSDVLKRLKEI